MYGAAIKQLVAAYWPLKDYLIAFADQRGRKIYDEALARSLLFFPQYVREMQGLSDGCCVPFYQVIMSLVISFAKKSVEV